VVVPCLATTAAIGLASSTGRAAHDQDAAATPAIPFYIVAHQDDWQLFMAPNVADDLGPAAGKAVFIHTTAGDAGEAQAYWLAREEGAISSVRFRLAPGGPLEEGRGTVVVNDHRVFFRSVTNPRTDRVAVCYFLRLPDGNPDGRGFPRYGDQSLEKLLAGTIGRIGAVDGSAEYEGREDLCRTIQEIIQKEAAGRRIAIHYSDPDPSINPGDHSDHRATGQVVQVLPGWERYDRRLYQDYVLAQYPADLAQHDVFWKVGMLAAYEKSVVDLWGPSEIGEDDSRSILVKWCLVKNRVRRLPPSASK
jgi:hypothetical protein